MALHRTYTAVGSRHVLLATAVVLLLLVSCHRVDPPTPYNISIPPGFPTHLNIPADNPMTEEGVELGRMLFEDPHLCGYQGDNPDLLMSCATCHVKAHNYDIGTDNPRFPDGVARGRTTGIATRHNVMPLMNLVFNQEGYFWNGNVNALNPNPQMHSIEDIVRMAIVASDEMCGTEEAAVAAILADSRYPEMFRKAFGTEEITMERIQKAIAQYVRSLVSANSKFDRYLQGKEQLTPQELHGYVLFTTEEGADCFLLICFITMGWMRSLQMSMTGWAIRATLWTGVRIGRLRCAMWRCRHRTCTTGVSRPWTKCWHSIMKVCNIRPTSVR